MLNDGEHRAAVWSVFVITAPLTVALVCGEKLSPVVPGVVLVPLEILEWVKPMFITKALGILKLPLFCMVANSLMNVKALKPGTAAVFMLDVSEKVAGINVPVVIVTTGATVKNPPT